MLINADKNLRRLGKTPARRGQPKRHPVGSHAKLLSEFASQVGPLNQRGHSETGQSRGWAKVMVSTHRMNIPYPQYTRQTVHCEPDKGEAGR